MRALSLLLLLLPGLALAQEPKPPPEVRGMALTMHSKDPEFDYGPMLAELPALGVTHVCVFVHFYQPNGRSPAPARHPLKTPTDAAIRRVLADIRRLGMQAGLLPILLLEDPASDEWRGNLSPPDRRGRPRGHDDYAGPHWEPWFSAYAREVLHFARVAEDGGATLFGVGSELSSTEHLDARWAELIRSVRQVTAAQLTYSANWDHYQHPKFWAQLDCLGLSGYYELATTNDAPPEHLAKTWVQVRERLLAWRTASGLERLPFLFLEVGYPSQDGGARHPWDYTRKHAVDLEEQRAAYQAFAEAWRGRPELLGVYFYEWWGLGGAEDGGYTPRGKPALDVLRRFFGAAPR